ncbi:MAG: CDP-diacylglycerol--glycerol-3-phosphate 3-phosphatidyltransferase [Desulfobacca sp.]|nr:CDP-diacylglycerol--glycerol-3-phosphate 3-phosphatidyltransferase [Desulfobacca sp.]
MSIPNIITLIRIVLIPWFAILLINGSFNQALWVFAGAAVSDGLDGLIARWFSQKTRLGSFLDPIADKLLLSTAYVALAVLKEIPVWLSVIVITRDVIIVVGVSILFFNQIEFEIKPTVISKITTIFQLFLVLLILSSGYIHFGDWLRQGLVFTTLICTILSGLHYIYSGLKILT